MAIVLQATWVSKPGHEEAVRDALAALAGPSREEPGNLGYTVYQHPDEPRVFRIFEVYADDATVTAHTESEHFQTWGFGVAIPLLEDRRREFFQTLDI